MVFRGSPQTSLSITVMSELSHVSNPGPFSHVSKCIEQNGMFSQRWTPQSIIVKGGHQIKGNSFVLIMELGNVNWGVKIQILKLLISWKQYLFIFIFFN